MEQEIRRKLSTKILEELHAQEAIFYGRAVDYKMVSTTYGPSIQFIGEFRAMVNGSDVARSNALYLPGAATSALLAKVDEARAGKGGQIGTKVVVDFGYRLYKRTNEKSRTGYEWVCEPVIESEAADDPLVALGARLAADSKNRAEKAAKPEIDANAKKK